MDSQNKVNAILRSVLTGTGVTLSILLIGTILDYAVTQAVSQFFISDCSEDCYFKIFNSVFVFVALLSTVGGARAGLRSYKRLTGN